MTIISNQLNVITACIRPNNLPLLAQSFAIANKLKIPINWIIVIDGRYVRDTDPIKRVEEIVSKIIDPNLTIVILLNDTYLKTWESPINLALALIKSGLVCIVDDDNIMHPEFIQTVYPIYLKEQSVGFVFHQLMSIEKGGNLKVRIAKFANLKPDKFDTAQFAITRDLIGDLKWCTTSNQPDGLFINTLFEEKRNKFKILDKILSYYNYLHPGSFRLRAYAASKEGPKST